MAKKAKHRKFQPMTIERCKKHIHDVNEKLGNNTGKTKDKLEKQSKKNTPEYHEKMRNRPQVANPKFIGWWKGKKQSKEHIEKRMNSSKPGDNS